MEDDERKLIDLEEVKKERKLEMELLGPQMALLSIFAKMNEVERSIYIDRETYLEMTAECLKMIAEARKVKWDSSG